MKRILSFVLCLSLLCAVLCGCRGRQEAGAPTAAPTAPEPAGPVFDDPYPAEAYQYHLGTPVDYDEARDSWNTAAKDVGTVRQVVYDYTPNAEDFTKSLITPLRVLEYGNFPSFAADEEAGDPPLFRGRYRLDIFDADPLSSGPWDFIPIRDPAVFGAFEEHVLSLDFSAPAQGVGSAYHFDFLLTDEDGNENYYTVHRDGTVVLNNSAAATVRLEEAVLDYFFAVHLASKLYSLEHLYWYSDSYDDTVYALRLTAGEKTVYLTRERRDSFAACFSDGPVGDPLPCAMTCVPRWNCGPGDHGAVLAEVSYGAYDEQTGEFTEYRTWQICEDGHVLFPRFFIIGPEYGYGYGQMTLDRLTGEGYLVSVSSFDTSVIEGYLQGGE